MEVVSEVTTDIAHIPIYKHKMEILQCRNNAKKKERLTHIVLYKQAVQPRQKIQALALGT